MRSHYYSFSLFFLLLASLLPAAAQVRNDSLAYRLELLLNQPLRSSTAHCTVEKACVDEQLSDRCIEYHNDQWFYFTAADIPAHYLTISGQNCRDIRGVQLLLLSGEPCQPETYQIHTCVSLASQEDIYLEAEGLEAGKTYLLNIDGYLHDFCSFSIQYTDTPHGIAANQAAEGQLEIVQQGDTVVFHWQAPAHLLNSSLQYELYRREAREKKFLQRQTIRHERNAYGESRSLYSSTDSLPGAGTYFYKLLARMENGESQVLAEREVKLKRTDQRAEELIIHLPFTRKTPYTVLLFDALSRKLLLRKSGRATKAGESLRIPLARWKNGEIKGYRAVLINDKSGEQKEWLFSPDGKKL